MQHMWRVQLQQVSRSQRTMVSPLGTAQQPWQMAPPPLPAAAAGAQLSITLTALLLLLLNPC
jgi:hypothetical protein